MKYFLLCFSLFLCLFSCSKQEHRAHWYMDNGKTKVLSTTAMIHDLVKEIGQDRVDPLVLIKGEVDPHSYELVKGDDEKIVSAAIVIGNGLNLEHGASLRYQLEKHSHVVYLGEEIRRQAPERILQVEGEIDPHVWMDISLWAEGIDAIVVALSKEDPEGGPFYQQRGDLLRQNMLHKHTELQKEMREVPSEKRYLVTSHDAFHYFARAYLAEEGEWEDRCVAPEGLAPEGQLSVHDIKEVVAHLAKYHIGVVFPESNVSRDSLKKIICSSPHQVRCSEQPLYGDAMGTNTYLEMIEHNIRALKGEWSSER